MIRPTRRLLPLLALFAALAALVAPLGAQLSEADRQTQLERWDSLSPLERVEVERRFQVLRGMSPEERRALEERAHALQPRRQGLADRVPGHLRPGLEGLSKPERRRALQDLLLEELRHEGRELSGLLPPELLEKLDKAPSHRRPAILHEWHERQREKGERKALIQLGRSLARPEAEIEDLIRLQPQERRRALLSLSRKLVERGIQRDGLPLGIGAQQVQAWRGLPDEAFLQEFFRSSGQRPYWWLLGPERSGLDSPGPGAGPGRGPSLDPDQRTRWGLLSELESQLRPGWEALELRHLPRGQRPREVRSRMRERCLGWIEEHGLIPPPELEALRALDEEDFAPHLMDLIQADRHRLLGWPPPGSRRGPLGRRPQAGDGQGPGSRRGPGGRG